jgi:hypothetical protein
MAGGAIADPQENGESLCQQGDSIPPYGSKCAAQSAKLTIYSIRDIV